MVEGFRHMRILIMVVIMIVNVALGAMVVMALGACVVILLLSFDQLNDGNAGNDWHAVIRIILHLIIVILSHVFGYLVYRSTCRRVKFGSIEAVTHALVIVFISLFAGMFKPLLLGIPSVSV